MGDDAKRFCLLMPRSKNGPVRVGRGGTYLLCIDTVDRLSLRKLLSELSDTLVADSAANNLESENLRRLFPVAYHQDPQLDEEYQRLMKSDLLASRLDSLNATNEALDRAPDDDKVVLTPHELDVFTRSINNLRLVIGTMLDVQESDDSSTDDFGDHLEDDDPARSHYHLYSYLGWLLDWAVDAQMSALEAE